MVGSIVHQVMHNHRLQDDSFLLHCHPKIKAFYEYWLSKCPEEGKIPSRKDISPIEMIPFLPGITMVEKELNGDLRYRLVGTMEVEMRGQDPTGMLVREGFHGTNEFDAHDNYKLVLDNATLLYDYDEFIDVKDVRLIDESLFLPLAADHVTPNMVIVFAAVRYARDNKEFIGR